MKQIPICVRLERREENKALRHGTGWCDAAGNGGSTMTPGPMVFVNPDGPEAAAIIREFVDRVQEARQAIRDGELGKAKVALDATLSRAQVQP